MKKFLFSGIVALALVVGVRPAVAGPGAHLGLNFASSSAGAGSSTEFMGGVFYESNFTDLFKLQPELNIIPKGGATYIAIPIFVKWKFDAGMLKPFLMVGPDFGLKISGAGAKTLDIAADFGGGLEYEVTPGVGLVASARYSLGLTNVSSIGSAKSRGVHVLAGVHVDL